jgi:RecA-family ATPase
MIDDAWLAPNAPRAIDLPPPGPEAKLQAHRFALPNGHDDADPPLIPIDPTTLDGIPVPERRWLVPDWIPMARVTAIYGAGGEGKTLLAQMLATSCALQKPWLGLRVRQCRSLLLCAEDDGDEMHARQADINAFYGCGFDSLGAMRWLPRVGEDCELMTFEGGRAIRTPLFDQVLNIARDHAAQLIVTDTLSDVFVGNENDRAQVRRFGRLALGHLAHELGAAVVAPAHPSLTGINRGDGDSASTGWKGTFRSQLYLSSPKSDDDSPDPDIRTLIRTKANWARRGDKIELRWKNGVFITPHAHTGIVGSIERHTCERIFADFVDQTTAEERPVSSNSRAGNYAPKLFAKRPDSERYTVKDFERAMEALFKRGEIINVAYGKPSNQCFRILRKPNGKDSP